MGSEVYTPWPISARSQKKVMLSSVPMRSQALGLDDLEFLPLDLRRLLAGRAGLIAITRPPTNVAARDNDQVRGHGGFLPGNSIVVVEPCSTIRPPA